MAYSKEDGVVKVRDVDPQKEIAAMSDAVIAKKDFDRKWQLRKESMACNAGIDLTALDAIQAQSGLSWPELELVIATLQINRYKMPHDG